MPTFQVAKLKEIARSDDQSLVNFDGQIYNLKQALESINRDIRMDYLHQDDVTPQLFYRTSWRWSHRIVKVYLSFHKISRPSRSVIIEFKIATSPKYARELNLQLHTIDWFKKTIEAALIKATADPN